MNKLVIYIVNIFLLMILLTNHAVLAENPEEQDVKIIVNEGSVAKNVSEVNIYPNPFVRDINIDANMIVRRLIFCTMDGLVVKHQLFNDEAITLPTDELSRGAYIVKVRTEDGKWHSKRMNKQ